MNLVELSLQLKHFPPSNTVKDFMKEEIGKREIIESLSFLPSSLPSEGVKSGSFNSCSVSFFDSRRVLE